MNVSLLGFFSIEQQMNTVVSSNKFHRKKSFVLRYCYSLYHYTRHVNKGSIVHCMIKEKKEKEKKEKEKKERVVKEEPKIKNKID